MPVWGPILGKMNRSNFQDKQLRISNLARYLENSGTVESRRHCFRQGSMTKPKKAIRGKRETPSDQRASSSGPVRHTSKSESSSQSSFGARVSRRAADRLRAGHVWVYASDVESLELWPRRGE